MQDEDSNGINRRKVLRNISAAGIALTGSSGVASAEQGARENGPKFNGGTVLTPEKGVSTESISSLGIKKVVAKQEKDTSHIFIEGSLKESIGYTLETNHEKGTYSLVDVSRPTFSSNDVRTQVTDTDCARIEVRTLDGANVVCARTIQELKWDIDTNIQYVSYNDRWKEGVGFNPTAAGTNWYKSYCDWDGEPYYVDGSKAVRSDIQAKYWNSDFPCGGGETYAYHDFVVEGDINGTSQYFANISHTGECHELLHPRIETHACSTL